MKPLSLEGLRRLVRGGRDKQGQQQTDTHHFRRSSSFKRASLRRSARRHEKITLPNGLVVKTSALQRKSSVSSDERRDDGYSTDGGDAGGYGTASTGFPRRVITYDEWRVAVSDEDSLKHTDESLPSTLSTNKLSSLDSGVRHSLDSKKKFSIESTKRLSLDRRKTLGVDIGHHLSSCGSPLLARDPRRGLDAPNFRRSVSAESPVPPLRIKSLLGSPRIAPKTREPPTTPARSLHNTPSRTRSCYPVSAPPTPGKTHVHHVAGPLTPTHQLRASWHERETRRCAVHIPPGSPKLVPEVKPQGSPKPQSRWSALFSGSFFSRSPSRKNQQQIEAQQQLEEQRRQQEQLELEKQHHHYLYNSQVCGGSPMLVRQRSVHSCESPSLLRHSGAYSVHPSGPVSLGGYGVARAQGGPRPRNDLNTSGPRSLGVPPGYGSPSAIPRHLVLESSPIPRQKTYESGTLGRQISHDSSVIGHRLSHDSGLINRQVSHDSGPVSRQISNETMPMCRQISHDSGPMSRQISHDSGPMSRQISHDSGPISRQISHDSGPMSRQISHDSGPMSRQISHDSGPMSRQISHDSGPMSRQISHDTGPMSRQISHDTGPMSRQISHDSGPMSRQISHDNGPMSRQIPHDSGPVSRQISHDSGPISRQMSHDSGPMSRHISHDTGPMSRQISHDSGPMSRQISHDSGQIGRQISHDSGPMSRQISHDIETISRQIHDSGQMNRLISHDTVPVSRHMSHDTVPMSCLTSESGPMTHHYYEPVPLTRHLSHEPPAPSSPALLQRHRSIPPSGLHSPVFRPRPHSSPATTHSLKALQVLGEAASVVNSSQFYPGRLSSTCFGSGMTSASTIAYRPSSSDRTSSRTSSQERPVPPIPPIPPVPTHRPRTPVSMIRHAVHPGRPLSLAMSAAPPCPDLISPASVTSEASSRAGRRRRGPGLLVGRASWLSRAASGRKSSRKVRRTKKAGQQLQRQEGFQSEELDERVPGRAGRALGPEAYQVLRDRQSPVPQLNPMVFVPPQRRRSSGAIKIQHTLLRRLDVPEIRTAHAHLLMPLNQPVGSHMVDGRSQKAAQLVRSMLEEDEQEGNDDGEGVRDTASEPGGAKFSVKPGKKPKSEPSTARLNLRVAKNPELILRALGVIAKLGKSKPEQSHEQLPNEAANERIITQLLLQDLTQDKSGKGSLVGSAESLVESMVSSRGSNGTTKPIRRVRRKKSQKRQPTVPAYPSWKRTPRLRSPRGNNGDITQKGYEKKKARLLHPYVIKDPGHASHQAALHAQHSSGASSRSRRTEHRSVTTHERRYLSEVRQEAVKEALAQYQTRPKNLPLPSKRSSVMTARSPDRHHRDSDSEDSDEDSVTAEGSLGSSGGHSGSQGTPEVTRTPLLLPPPQVPAHGSGGGTPASSSGSSHHTPPPHPLPPKQQQPLPPIPPHSLSNGGEEERRRREMTEVTDLMRNITSFSQPPDVTNNTGGGNNRAPRDDRITRYSGPAPGRQSSSDAENWRGTGRWKVSNKIQQLLNTLKRPKRRPLPEFYLDDEEDLEIAANPKDPNAPKPEGMVMTPARGEQLVIPAGLPRSVEDAVYRYGSSSGYKAPVATILDANGKLSVSLTYGKLLSRSQKMAYNLLTRLGGRGEGTVMPGDRVALVYPNNDPVSFMCAFYACLQAGLVPVPIEVPLSRRDAGSQQIGFLLGSCGVSVALTSEACFKGIPKTSAGEVVSFKGWPKLTWFITDHLPKPPKDWQTPPRHSDDTAAYIEYCTDKDGSVKGVVVTRSAMLAHCRTLTSACNYTEGEVAVCVLDFKREVGLWHSMLCSVFNGMHVIFIPYSVMKVNPASWMHMITRFKASIAIVKSRDLHWGLLATKDHKDVSLQSLRLLLVADGANPWSLSSCDQFLAVFQSKGLRPDAICPCASSPEALTVSVRRPGHGGANAVGRGVLSMQGLSYGVVRVDQENSLTSLTLQDCGQVLPGAMIIVVKLEGQPFLCRTDEVGEICVAGGAVGDQYWGLQGMTNTTFKVQPLLPDNTPMSDSSSFVRTGLLGFLGPGGLVFVCGSRDGLMTVTGRKHNTDDIIATVLAVEPMKFIYRGRIAVFSHRVLRDERICVIAEQRPDCSEEESFQWMSRVLQAVDSIHQVGIYCLALVPPNHLPKTPLGGIHLSETRKKFLEGSLHPANVLMCPHTCVTNLPKPREVHHDVGPASVMVGNLVQGNRLASAQGRDMGLMDNEDGMRRHPQFIADILKWRASTTENHEILTLLNSKSQVATSLTCAQLHKKAERVGCLLLEKGHINTGDHVALIYPPGVDLIASFYGCLYVGAVPVTIRPPHPQNLQSTVNTVRTVVDVSKSSIILSTLTVIKLLKSKEEKFDSGKKWPPILDTDDLPKKRLPSIYKAPTPEMIAYLDFSVSTTGMLAGIKMSHGAATSLCLSMKVACELYPSRVVALCLDPYCGLGLALWVLSSVYSGHQSILIPPGEVELNPSLWLSAVSQYKVRDTFCSYGVMELCTKGLGSSIVLLKQRGVNLACVRTCVVVAEERPRVQLTNSFSKLFCGLGLSPRAVSTSFGCRVNVTICLQGASSPDPTTVYVDLRSLRHDRVTLVERGAPHSLCIMESGKLLPGVKVVIANPDTKGQCSDSHLGEIWVQCNHNASGYFTVYGDDGTANDHFNAQLVTGNTGETYARTGYLGFLRRTESVQADGELHDAVFVVGALDETVILRGMRYHPIDIEMTVMRCHKKISECAVFNWTNLLVVVVELDGAEYEALDLVPLITSSVLEEHQIIVGVIVVVDPGVVPINSRGEKQRMHLRDGFLADQLDPIYVAYNM